MSGLCSSSSSRFRLAVARLVLGAAIAVLAAACGGAGGTPSASPPPASVTAPASPSTTGSSPAAVTASVPGSVSESASAAPSSPVVGIVLTIDSAGLTEVHGFTFRTSDGQVLSFRIGQLDNPTQFPPGHLAEHQAAALPVRVYFRQEQGALVVYRLEDAG